MDGALKQGCLGVNNKHHAAETWDLEFVFQTPQKVFSNTTKKLFVKNHIICFPSLQPCWVGFKISLSLSRESAIFRDEIENYFSCSHLARRDRDYHMTILVFRDENEIVYCNFRVSRRDRDFRKSFLMVEKKLSWLSSRISGVENSRWALLWSVLMDFAGTSKIFLNLTFPSTHFENSHMLPTGPSCLKLNQRFKKVVLMFAPSCAKLVSKLLQSYLVWQLSGESPLFPSQGSRVRIPQFQVW